MPVVGRRAVVLGGSLSGLLAARVLADFHETVTVVERDPLVSGAANRRGVPQGRHPHALMARGAMILDELFPGLLSELAAAGANVLDDGDFGKIYIAYGGHVLVRSGTARDPKASTAFLQSRPFLEGHVRRRIEAIPNITVLAEHDVVEMTASPDGGRVTGVRVAERGHPPRELGADLVIDAMGRGAHTPAFLQRLGYGRPVEEHVVVRTTYVSRMLRMTTDLKERMIVIGAEAGRPSGMFLVSYEGGVWMFTVWGMVGQEPPTDLEGMVEFARTCAPDHVLAAVRAATPVGDFARHRMPSSQWRRYDKMATFPEGLLVTGDAICSFNPVYGQGMTIAALDALALRECLQNSGNDLRHRFFAETAKSIGVAWRMAAGNDLRFPEVQGRRTLSSAVTNRCADWALAACATDAVVAERFFRVNNFIDPPSRLLHPSFAFQVAMANWRSRKRTTSVDRRPRQHTMSTAESSRD